MKGRHFVAILFTFAVAVTATNAPPAQAADRTEKPKASAPKASTPKASAPGGASQDIASQWTLFQQSAEGRYCFFHREKDVPKSHNGYVFLSIKGETLTLEQGGILRPDNQTLNYTEELTGSRQGDKITATFTKSNASTEFAIGNRTLTNLHFMADEEVTYAFEACEN
jgi:hypothetical protein